MMELPLHQILPIGNKMHIYYLSGYAYSSVEKMFELNDEYFWFYDRTGELNAMHFSEDFAYHIQYSRKQKQEVEINGWSYTVSPEKIILDSIKD